MRLKIIVFVVFCSWRASGMDLIDLSGRFLFQIKSGHSMDSVPSLFRKITAEEISKALPTDTKKKTFWINIYNAWYQVLAQRGFKAPRIFTEKALYFKDFALSLDDIEHGILRKHRWKYSLGYFGQLAPGKIILLLTVDKIDFRIHFALNCGARSCPPIAFYEEAHLNDQLQLATRSFLQSETKVDPIKKVIQVTKIMQWFSADFGGGDGQLKILSTYLGRDFTGYRILYKDYDWTADLMNFSGGH